ncbi:Unknown protein [Striga hermonthica]|uniref:Uncharacterized protein n=1 Tax=Striga hermonthica TaxID=68872 RepID=A0A9N7NPS9_STRHE|nr:Unknown protein [Striga hermonthica]
MSGFAWNPTTKQWDAEPQTKPKAATLRFLYGNDRATCEDAETAFEMSKRRASSTENLFTTTIDEVDNPVSENKVVLENNWNSIDVENDIFSLSTQHGSKGANTRASSKKRKKKDAIKDKASEFEIMKGTIDNVATALREGNELFKDMYSRKVPSIYGEETWALINECGFESNLLTDICCYLMNDTDKLRCVVQCPSEARKDFIMRMMFGPSNPPL